MSCRIRLRKQRVSAKSKAAALKCAYCHDRFDARNRAKRCYDCGLLLHKDCWVEAESCPTLGCDVINPSWFNKIDKRIIQPLARFAHVAHESRFRVMMLSIVLFMFLTKLFLLPHFETPDRVPVHIQKKLESNKDCYLQKRKGNGYFLNMTAEDACMAYHCQQTDAPHVFRCSLVHCRL